MTQNQKPIEIIYRDFSDTLTTLVNNSGLPAFVVASALRNVLYQVDQIADIDYRRALAEYDTNVNETPVEETAGINTEEESNG